MRKRKYFFKHKQTGNALVEFAIVLPLLTVFTMGSVYLSIAFAQKSVMNGLAFSEARAALVRKDKIDIHKIVKDKYQKDSGIKQAWIEKIKPNIFLKDRKVNVILAKEPMKLDMLVNALSMLGGSKPNGDKPSLKEIRATSALTYEYIIHNQHGSLSERPETFSVVDYNAPNPFEKFILALAPADFQDFIKKTFFVKLVDQKEDPNAHNSKRADDVLSANSSTNMKTLKSNIYGKYGMYFTPEPDDKPTVGEGAATEEPIGNIANIDGLNFLRATGDHIKKIEAGTITLNAALLVFKSPGSPLAAPFSQVQKFVGKSADQIQIGLSDASVAISLSNTAMFRDTSMPR